MHDLRQCRKCPGTGQSKRQLHRNDLSRRSCGTGRIIFSVYVIREVWEETGLKIENPKLRGVYHWHRNGIHNVLFLYKAEKFSGELKSSEEGKVYWIPLEELKKRELATGMEYVLEIMESDQVNECYMKRETQGYVGTLY